MTLRKPAEPRKKPPTEASSPAGGRPDAPRWRRKPEERPEAILDGALIEFRTRGFSGARIEDIARHAGLSKGTVYLYFDSKEAMLQALVERTVKPIAMGLQQMAAQMLSAPAADMSVSAADMLRMMLQMAAQRTVDSKVSAMPLLIIAEAGNFPELVHRYRADVVEVVMQAVEGVIARGIENGEFRRNVTPHIAVRSFIGVILLQLIWNGVFLRSDEDPLSPEEITQSHLDLFLNGIVAEKEKN
ncbi:TetR/AcrR family transcriptional regulator [Paremcibacter congregatus]|nr:TetR/AcrR family transcriptional regulator [Paremcibacter congregatus]